jgi:hypothetical protein
VIDFRYHIVSLIAVFLALAVGVVLGAGPLGGTFGEQLTAQVETLRQEKEALRIQLEDARADNEDLVTFVDSAAAQLLPGTLTDVGVTVLELPEADSDTVSTLLDRVEQGGGQISGRVAATSRWTDPADQAVRDQAAAEIRTLMLIPPADATSEQVLGHGLALALSDRDPLASEAFSSTAGAIYAVLLDAGLIEEDTARTAPADVMLVVAPAPLQDPGEAEDADAAALAIEVATVTGFAGQPAVLAGTDDDATDLVDAVRNDPDGAAAVSTVDSIDAVTGQVITPLALAAVYRGVGVSHYGLAPDVTAVLPQLPELPETSGEDPTEDPTEDDS